MVAIAKHPGFNPQIIEPIDSMKCRTEQEALEFYEDFLVRKCHCKWIPSPGGAGNAAGSKDHHFVEVGNLIAKRTADFPAGMTPEQNALVGSW